MNLKSPHFASKNGRIYAVHSRQWQLCNKILYYN